MIWINNLKNLWFEKLEFIENVVKRFESTVTLRPPILDVGCGRCRFLDYLRKHNGIEAYGTDFSFTSMKQCHCVHNCVQAECGVLPFAANTFRSITSILLIEHVPGYLGFLKETFRVLKQDGCIYLLFPNFHSLVTPALFLKRKIFRNTEIPYHEPLRLQNIKEKLEVLDFVILSVHFMSITEYRNRVERIIGKIAGQILPDRFKEEIIIIAKKR